MSSSQVTSMQFTWRPLCLCLLMLISGMQISPHAWSQTSKSLDVPLRYTVKVKSQHYGNVSAIRAIVSGAEDDFIWRMEPPTGAVPVDARCPHIDDELLLNVDHAMLRQIKIRLAPVVKLNRMATIQLNFSAHTPQGSHVYQLGKDIKIHCPVDQVHQEIRRFDIPLNGQPKQIILTDGTKIVVSVKH